MATVTKTLSIHPSGYTGASNLTIPTTGSYAITNAYKSSGNTSNYCRITVNTSTTGYFYLTFDTSEIPEGATITGISGTVTVRVSNTQRVTNTVCQLYSGTTAKGSNKTFASTTASNTVTLDPGAGWTRANLDDLRLRIGGTGSSSTQTKYIYLYGATINITYTVSTYDITIQNSTSATVTASADDAAAGDSVDIFADTLDGITVTDNGADVTAQFVRETGGTETAVPGDGFTTGFSESGANFYQSSSTTGTGWLEYAIGHSAESPYSTSDTSNTYVKPEGATGWINYEFDFSEIPAGATITAMSVKVYGARENATVDSTHVARFQCYAGNVAKGTIQSFTSTSNGSVTVTDPGTWTAEELHDARLRFEIGYYGGRMLGITWSVTYQADDYVYTITAIAENHVIVVAPSGGGGNPPVITVGTPNVQVISSVTGHDQCVCTFKSDLALSQWEARATKAGVTPARGVGLLVESGGALAANTNATIYVENEELTNGDGVYTITVYGQSTGGVWSE